MYLHAKKKQKSCSVASQTKQSAVTGRKNREHLNFEENQEFNAFVNCQLLIVNGKAIDKRDEKFFYFYKYGMLPKNLGIIGNKGTNLFLFQL